MVSQPSAKPTCPSCGRILVLRSSSRGQFWGCSGYPTCRFTKNYDPAWNKPADTNFAPSAYQQAVFDFIISGVGNAFIEAVAGSGKTTTIIEALKFTTGAVAFFAFNKSIAKELSKRVPFNVQASTLHSHGFACLNAVLQKPVVDEDKKYSLAEELLPNDNYKYARSVLVNLTSMIQNTLTDVNDKDAVAELIARYGIETNGCEELVLENLSKMVQLCAERTSIIDYEDMIWLPIYLNLPIKQYDWVFCDEAQDLNAAQIQLVLRSVRKGGRIVCVGDRNQSIYGFRGADVEAIPNLIKATNAVVLPLSISYRCPTNVVKLVRQLVPQIEASDTAIPGEIRYNIPSHKLITESKSGDMILCRINAPLVTTCYNLIRAGKKAVIRGRDIGKGLIQLVEKMKAADVAGLVGKLELYRRSELEKLMKKNARESQILSLNDKIDTLVALTDNCRDLTELRARIEVIFSDKEEGIICSSVHRAKGLEADNVYIINPALMPFPKATKDWEITQETNLIYVACTRAKKCLTFVEGAPKLQLV